MSCSPYIPEVEHKCENVFFRSLGSIKTVTFNPETKEVFDKDGIFIGYGEMKGDNLFIERVEKH